MAQTMVQRLKPCLISALSIGVLLCLVYLPSLRHDFIINWDDNLYVTENEAVKGVSLAHIKEAFSSNYVGNYAPLQIISYMFDYSLFGDESFGFILMNIVWHALNGVLLYCLLMKLYDNPGAAFFATALFLLHPVQVESVVWVSQRKNLLSMFFFLISLRCYLRYCEIDKPHGNYYYLMALIGFVAALLTKSVTVIMPLILVLYISCFLDINNLRRRLSSLFPFVLLSLAFVVITFYSQSADYLGGGRVDLHGGSRLYTMLTMMTVLVSYLGMLFWPFSLCASYHVPVRKGIDPQVMLAMVTILLLIALAVYLYRLRKDLFFWYAFFFVGLIPVSQIIPIVTLMNDRYLYFPMLGAAGLCAAVMDSCSPRLMQWPGYLLSALIGLVLLALAHLSWQQSKTWQNALTLWQHATTISSQKAQNWHYLGRAHYKSGQLDSSITAYLGSLERENNCVVQNDLAIAYLDKRDFSSAFNYLKQATVICPNYVNGWTSLGDAYLMNADLVQAEQSYLKTLQLKPGYQLGLIGIANVNLLGKKFEESLAYFLKAGIKKSTDPNQLYNYACAAALAGRMVESLDSLELAIKYGFNDVNQLQNDQDLDSVRRLDRFNTIVGVLGKKSH